MRALVALLAAVGLVGCRPSLDSSLATTQRDSVNGVDVLVAMAKDRGWKTEVRRGAGDKLLDRGDVLVWFPHADAIPTESEIEWAETWLQERPRRTLVYVGPWFDATPTYWSKVAVGAPADEVAKLLTERDEAAARWDQRKGKFPIGESCEWFSLESPVVAGDATTLASTVGAAIDGKPTWTRGIDPKKLELDVPVRLESTYESDVFLEVGGRPLVQAVDYYSEEALDGRLLLVTNGTFLYNLPLVNAEHRELAGRLLDSVERFARSADDEGESSGAGEASAAGATNGPRPLEAIVLLGGAEPKPPNQQPSHWAMLGVPPLSYVLLQLAALGLLFCFSRWPMVGRPRELATSDVSDFGRHVEALGDLLEQTGDERYADRRVKQWRGEKR